MGTEGEDEVVRGEVGAEGEDEVVRGEGGS